MNSNLFAAQTYPRKQVNGIRCIADETLALLLVCNGLGSAAAADIAVERATDTVYRVVEHRKLDSRQCLHEAGAVLETLAVCQEAMQRANCELRRLGLENPNYGETAAALTMVLISGEKAVMAHIGDTRLYLSREDELHQLSLDHTISSELECDSSLQGGITDDNTYRRILTRALGSQEHLQVDTLIFDLLPDDVLVLTAGDISLSSENTNRASASLEPQSAERLSAALIDAAKKEVARCGVAVVVAREAACDIPQENRSKDILKKLRLLRRMYLFQDLSLREVLDLMNYCRVEERKKEEVVIREGKAPGDLYVILDGEFVVERQGQEIARLRHGDHFGEMSLLSHLPRSATIRAAVNSRLIALARDDLVNIIHREPVVGTKLLWRLADQLALRLEMADIELVG